MNTPREPSADLRRMASLLHQTYIALVAEGFTEAQALQVIAAMLAANGRT
jgi:hypothetical protein